MLAVVIRNFWQTVSQFKNHAADLELHNDVFTTSGGLILDDGVRPKVVDGRTSSLPCRGLAELSDDTDSPLHACLSKPQPA
jgi:hypothetical protein